MTAMLSRRVLYGAALLAVLVFQITNSNYLAHFLLALTLSLPVLSLALSLPGMARCRLTLTPSPAVLDRGEAAQWTVSADNPGGLPLPRVTVRVTQRSLFTGERAAQRLVLSANEGKGAFSLPALTSHCGLLELRASRFRVVDYLGLFALPRPAPEAARMLVLPIPAEPGPIVLPEGSGLRPSPNSASRKGPGDDYDLRDYRPGDSMRAVHWKLSTKWDQLIVREKAESLVPLPLLTIDRFGTPDELDGVLDSLLGVCQALLAVQRPHGVLWLDGEGTPVLRLISDGRELRDCMLAILSDPAPLSGRSLKDDPDVLQVAGESTYHLHITAPGRGEGPAHG